MIYDRILVRYGELSIKGKNRKYFKNALHKIIRRKLRGIEQLKYEVTRDRFYIILNGVAPELVTEQLVKFFELKSYSLTARCKNEIDAKTEKASFGKRVPRPV
jgi:thiamine biosynthesis protein ThiI